MGMLAAAAALTLTLFTASGKAAPESPAGPAEAVARLDATDSSGRTWTSADLRGRVTLIDFWATWCAPCLAELPRLQELRGRHSREDFEILGISLDVTDRRAFVSWLNRNRIDWPQVHERSGYEAGVPALFGIESLPRTILLDRDGAIAAVDLRGEALARTVDRLVVTSRTPGRVTMGVPARR